MPYDCGLLILFRSWISFRIWDIQPYIFTKEIEFHYIYVSGINGYYKLRIADLRTAVSNRGIKTGTMEYKLGSPWYAFVILLRMKKAIEDEEYEKWLIS